MFHVVLFEPEIPPNTGNIIRLCANTGSHLHLIRPLGFELDDRRLKRAGLDYREWARMRVHDTLDDFLESVAPPRVYALSTHATRSYAETSYAPGDALLFGPETRGLPAEVRVRFAEGLRRIPMVAESRSLNLSNAATAVLYEAWRQNGFAGAG
ncbi:MAG: tRNA (cytidine(34)-2'-O)-methyltransferase [Gammaproteobacteria bacterium]|jgi:tRNA (cytidine/uridine-2'-O-)-methyltransferase